MWYIIYNGQQVGPLEKDQLVNYNLNPDSMVWCEGMADWVPASQVPALAEYFQPIYGRRDYYRRDYYRRESYGGRRDKYVPRGSEKSKIAAGLLAIFFGPLGVQYFYLGKVGGGFLTILLSIVTCGAWEIITLIQGILMICMSDEEFDRKYVYNDKTFPLF